jgi:phosphate transport system protein
MLQQNIDNLKKEIINYSFLVDRMIEKAIKGLVESDKELLLQVINEDEKQANRLEVEIEEMSIVMIAKYSPKAKDLRTILMILKMNNDLERIGDHAVDISESAMYLIERPKLKSYIDIPRMAALTRQMLSDAIDSFIEEDNIKANEVCKKDDIIDDFRDQILRELITYMSTDFNSIERALRILNIARHLERIADLSTNICEDVIYMVEGKNIKHHSMLEQKGE